MANKLTQTAGLTFNVNTVKTKLKKFYESRDIPCPMFSGGHTAITASLEKLYELILKECIKRTGKDKSGVRTVNREMLLYSVMMNPGFKEYYTVPLEHYDDLIQYDESLPVDSAEMLQVVDRVDKELGLSKKAENLMSYMLLNVYINVASVCSQFLAFSKRKSLDGNCVMFALTNCLPDSIASELRAEVVRVMKAFGEELEDNSSDNVKVKETEEAGEEGSKKNAKGGKKVPQVDEEEAGEGEEEAGEEEAEEVAEPAPKKPVGKPAAKPAAKPAVNNAKPAAKPAAKPSSKK